MKTISNKRILLPLVLLACLSLAAAFSHAQPQPRAAVNTPAANDADPRLVAAMERSGLEYEIDADGDVKILLKWDDGRSQAVWANSIIETYEGMEIREVWTVVAEYESKDDILPRILVDLLSANFKLKFGKYALLVNENSGEVRVLFILTIAADLDGPTLAKVISFVGEIADEKEIELEDNQADKF